MKRSNRLVLLIGVFLAVVAFVGSHLSWKAVRANHRRRWPPSLPTVVATRDIPLGVAIKADMLKRSIARSTPSASRRPSQTRSWSSARPSAARSPTAPRSRPADFIEGDRHHRPRRPRGHASDRGPGRPGLRRRHVINTGDYVDMLVGFTGDKFPVVTAQPAGRHDHRRPGPQQHQRQARCIQGMQVLGRLLPAPTPSRADPEASPGAGGDQGQPRRRSPSSRRSSSWASRPSRPK